jgi:hypothetical protein
MQRGIRPSSSSTKTPNALLVAASEPSVGEFACNRA